MRGKGPNEHWLDGDTMHIKLTQGKEALVDAEDWPLVSQYRWHTHASGKYAWHTTHQPKHGDGVFLHHLLVGKPQRGYDVNHISGSGLDNRRANLEVITHQQNSQHKRRSGQSNNTTGCKNVCRHRVGRWTYWWFRCGWNGHGYGSSCCSKHFPYTDEGYADAVAFAHHHWDTVHPDCPGYEPEQPAKKEQVA